MLVKMKTVSKQMKKLLKSKKGFFVDTGVLILISVVLGSLLLGGLYAVANDTVFPSATEKIESLFEYSGDTADAPLVGDINKDGVVNNSDKNILNLECMTWSGKYTIEELDLTGDGVVNMQDVTRLKKLIEEFSEQ